MSYLRPALALLIGFALITGLAYPLAITGIAQIAMPHQANGSLIARDGKVIGSSLIGQNFTSDGYFWPRPSATVGVDADGKPTDQPYNPSASTGSNLGPTSAKLVETIKARAAAFGAGRVPGDLVTASASGLDPDISPEAAAFQAKRIAADRRLPEARVSALIDAQTEGPALGLFGAPHVNVLRLNLALDDLSPRQ